MISGQEGLFFFFFFTIKYCFKKLKAGGHMYSGPLQFLLLVLRFCCSMLSFEKKFFFLFYYFKKVYLLAINTPIFTLSWNVFISPVSPECIFHCIQNPGSTDPFFLHWKNVIPHLLGP